MLQTRPSRARLGAMVLAIGAWGCTHVAANEPVAPTQTPAQSPPPEQPNPALSSPAAPAIRRSIDLFLDRLMLAESGGRDKAKNPKSSALGPYQFIESTWLDVVRRHVPAEAEKRPPAALLAMRTDRAFARQMAEAYTRDNAKLLMAAGHKPTYGLLRLAFFAGFQGTNRLLQADQKMRSVAILGPGVAKANPFLHGMTVADVIARMARDTGALRDVVFEGPAPTAAEREVLSAAVAASKLKSIPRPFTIRCNQALPACRRWVALAEVRAKTPVARAIVTNASPAAQRAQRASRAKRDRALAGR